MFLPLILSGFGSLFLVPERGFAGSPLPDTPLSATITVNASTPVRQIPRELFGTNIEWTWDSWGLWSEATQQVNPTILNLSRDLGVTVLRFPGGQFADYYRWKDGVGPHSARPLSLHQASTGDKSRPNFGTDEALAFADQLGAELLITVNAGTGTAQEAADWVRYVNATKLRVRYWEVGNELYINDGSVDSRILTIPPATYAARFLEFAQAMRAADPRIKIGAIGGHNQGRYQVVSYPDWNRIVLTQAASQIDFLSVHNAYAPVIFDDSMDARSVYKAMFAFPELLARNLKSLAEDIALYAPARAPAIPIAVTEWGPLFQVDTAGKFVDHNKTLSSALYSASVFKTFLESPSTQMANFHALHDLSIMGWIGNLDPRFPPNPQWAPTARYYAFQMFRRHFGDTLVQSSCTGVAYDSPAVGWVDAVQGVPYLDVVASASLDGKQLYVLAINKSFDNSVQSTIAINGFRPAATGVSWTLSGTGIDVNTGTAPLQLPGVVWAKQTEDSINPGFYNGQVTLTSSAVASVEEQFSYRFPPHSVTSIVLTRQ